MPNIITHCLFGKDVFEKLNESQKQIIHRHPREFMIGCNGPDFFFFYKFFEKQYAPIRHYGSLVHAEKINEFYTLACSLIEKEPESECKEAMISYIMGHLCHWALDSSAHPYIFYKTGHYLGMSESMHHRFESMLDTMMLQEIKGQTIRQFNFPLLARTSNLSVQAISNIYIPIMREVYGKDLSSKQIADALSDWFKIQKYLKDTTGIKTKILKVYEKVINHPWLYSGNVIPVHIDETYDVLNLQKKMWCYPVDKTKTSHESFLEIYERATNLAVQVIQSLKNSEALCKILNHCSYDTGIQEKKEMIYFDLIYGENE